MKTVFTIWIMFCVITTATGQVSDASEGKYWENKIRVDDAGVIVADLADSEKPRWPEIRTAYSISKLSVNSRAEWEARTWMIDTLLSKVGEWFLSRSPKSVREMEGEVEQFIRAARRLEERGGYVDRLLADTFYQMSMFRISEQLVVRPNLTREIKGVLSKIKLPEIDVSAMVIRYQGEDPRLDRIGPIMYQKGRGNLAEQLIQAGISQNEAIRWAFNPGGMTNRELLRDPSIVLLLGRIALTKADWNALLGSAEYILRGGSLSMTALNDNMRFEEIMGKEVFDYGCKLIDRNEIHLGVIRGLVSRHSTDDDRRELRNTWWKRLF